MSMEINKKMRELRKDAKMTQQQVAQKLGIASTTYANYEQGTREPSLSVVSKLCKLYGISADYLLGITD